MPLILGWLKVLFNDADGDLQLLGGSSQDLQVVNNHGDRKSRYSGCGTPGLQMGVTNYLQVLG